MILNLGGRLIEAFFSHSHKVNFGQTREVSSEMFVNYKMQCQQVKC